MKYKLVWYNGKVVDTEDLKTTSLLDIQASQWLNEYFIVVNGSIFLEKEIEMRIRFLVEEQNCISHFVYAEKSLSLKKEVSRLLVRNRCFSPVVIKYQMIFFSDTYHEVLSIYEPYNIAAPASIKTTLLNNERFIYSSILKNRLIYQVFLEDVLHYIEASGCDDAFIVDNEMRIKGSAKGAIFLKKDNVIYTPMPRGWLGNDVLIPVIIKLCREMGVQLKTNDYVEAELLFSAEEIFTASLRFGVRAIKGVENHRYYDQFRKELLVKLLEFIETQTME